MAIVPAVWSLGKPALFTALEPAQRVLIAGAGGGFDVYCGLPLAFALKAAGKQVHLANLSFTYLDLLDLDDWVTAGMARITPESKGASNYFPERTLARWLKGGEGLEPVVYAFQRMGVKPLRAAYRWLIQHLDVDAVVLVDGGTDILMRGDEAGLGTPDTLDAVEHAAQHTPGNQSIVNGQIAAAIRGDFGDKHFTTRTGGSELFINPLMAMYFSFQLTGVYRHLLYRSKLEQTETHLQVGMAIEGFRQTVDTRPRRVLPH